jgi:hypothetical protein
MARIIQLVDNARQQSHNPSQQPRNPPQQIRAFHFNSWPLLRTNRHIEAADFAGQRLQMEFALHIARF